MSNDEAELTAELIGLRTQLAETVRQAEVHSLMLQRARTRELALLQAENLPALLDHMVGYLRDSYALRAVSLVLSDPRHEIRHLLLDAGRTPDAFPDVLFFDSLFGIAPQLASLRTPWLGPYQPSDHQLLFPVTTTVGSIALLPLRRQDRLIGCLNFGSAGDGQFTHPQDSEFLGHLAVIASYCLENMINRARLLRSGYTDVLTGWHNRRYLQTRLREELARARRDGTTLACLMLDVDHFKSVNDRFGHLVGDQVLREIAQRLETQVRASDVTARYGGEEFAIVLPQSTVSEGLLLAERIRAAVARDPFDAAGTQHTVTISIGVADLRPADYEGDYKALGEALIARADAALYAAKAAGRNRVAAN